MLFEPKECRYNIVDATKEEREIDRVRGRGQWENLDSYISNRLLMFQFVEFVGYMEKGNKKVVALQGVVYYKDMQNPSNSSSLSKHKTYSISNFLLFT